MSDVSSAQSTSSQASDQSDRTPTQDDLLNDNWAYLRDYFVMTATPDVNKNVTYKCILCLPANKEVKASKTTYAALKSCPASQVKRRPKCDRIAPSHPLSWPCVSDLLLLKGESWQRAFATLDDSTPQRRISELRVWSYEPFIVFAPSSSGYTSGQNLEVLYI